jgi:lipopolysaccharide/colanic/teichoic acid biosynthesis glycosyltransferase
MMKFQKFLKRQIDFWGSLIGLIISAPFFLIIALLIKIDSPGPVFFRQKRVGKDGKIFKIWKFRTMIEGAENIGLGIEIAKNDPRITRVGKFLRRFVIDELPQFINVILGEMSLVGPRTALPSQVKKYTDFEKKRLQVKPGMTNINIIKGWNILSWKERIKWDIWYIENWSLWLDLKILFKTFIIVLLGRGQYGDKGIVGDYK